MLTDLVTFLVWLAFGTVCVIVIGLIVTLALTVGGVFAFGAFLLLWERTWFRVAIGFAGALAAFAVILLLI